jgi:hypothetical protein
MNIANAILDFLKNLLAWWFLVEPWEQAVRVRFGKHYVLRHPGVHFKFPFFDIVYKQNVRRRTSSVPLQTLTTRDGKTMTVLGSLGYSIVDVLKLHLTLHDAESTIKQMVQGLVSEYVATHDLLDCTPAQVTAAVRAQLQLAKFGLGDVEFFLTGYVSNIRTYRLISDTMQWAYEYSSGLSTNVQHGVASGPR